MLISDWSSDVCSSDLIDAHHTGSDVIVAHRHEVAAVMAAGNSKGASHHHHSKNQAEIVDRAVCIDGVAEKLRRFERQAIRSTEPRLRQVEDQEMEQRLSCDSGEHKVEAFDAHR